MEAEAQGCWNPPPDEREAEPTYITEAKQQFLQDAESGRRLSESTLGKYKLMRHELEDFASKKGFRYPLPWERALTACASVNFKKGRHICRESGAPLQPVRAVS